MFNEVTQSGVAAPISGCVSVPGPTVGEGSVLTSVACQSTL